MDTAPVEVKKAATSAPDAWNSLRSEVDRLFDNFAAGFRLPRWSGLLDMAPQRFRDALAMPCPAMDITEDGESYKLTAELPGMGADDIDVSVVDGALMIKGEKKQETEKKERDYHLAERSYGVFERMIPLSDKVDRDKISAAFAKGVLTVNLPKLPQTKTEPKRIDVKATV